MVEMRKTVTIREVAEAFKVPASQVTWAESVVHWNKKGEALLAADPESLEGLSLTGQLDNGLADVLQYFCGSDQHPAYFPDYPRHGRISDVLMALEKAIRSRVGMGPKRWAEWLAFMEARGLEWGKPLSDIPNAPAGELGGNWNVYDFPSGKARLEITTRNSLIRSRWFSLSREINNFQSMLCEAVGEKNRFNNGFNSAHAGNGRSVECAGQRTYPDRIIPAAV
jgi:hypothetical protein